jgi:CRP/FNR family transcriptional regulator, cyclic AMP receptor protein
MNPAELFRRDDDPVRLAPGQTLFREGDTGDSMYVLLEGSADVFVGEILVESATPGALLGEMALVDSSPRTATVVATMPARLARIDERRFHFLVQQTPYFATHVMKVLAERLRHMNVMTEKSGAGVEA